MSTSRTACSNISTSTTLSDFATPIIAAKSRIPSAGKPRRRRPDERRHPRVVPSAHVSLVHEAQEHALRQDRVSQVEPGELVLMRARGHRQVLDEPVVERPVVLELQRADRVRDALDRVGLPVREVVGRVDAPRVARPRMLRVDDPVQDRIAQVDVAGGHVDPARASTRAPLGNSPARMRANRSRFSSADRSRQGLSLPGSVSVPRYSRISSAERSST